MALTPLPTPNKRLRTQEILCVQPGNSGTIKQHMYMQFKLQMYKEKCRVARNRLKKTKKKKSLIPTTWKWVSLPPPGTGDLLHLKFVLKKKNHCLWHFVIVWGKLSLSWHDRIKNSWRKCFQVTYTYTHWLLLKHLHYITVFFYLLLFHQGSPLLLTKQCWRMLGSSYTSILTVLTYK